MLCLNDLTTARYEGALPTPSSEVRVLLKPRAIALRSGCLLTPRSAACIFMKRSYGFWMTQRRCVQGVLTDWHKRVHGQRCSGTEGGQ